MTFAVPRPRTLVAMLGLLVATTPVALGQQSLGYQGGATSLGGGIGQPLNLLSPTFVAPPPRPGAPRAGGPVPGAVQAPAASAMMTAPLPLPRPASAPQTVITQASAPVAVAASAIPTTPQQTLAQAGPHAAEATQPPLLRPSMDDWPQDEDRGRVIIPGAYERPRPAPATAIEAIAAAAPQQGRPQAEAALPGRAVSFAAPVPLVRPGATSVVAMTPTGPAGTVLASASSTPVTLSNQGTATTMVVPSAPAGSIPGAQQAVIVSPTPARGPVLAALPPDGGSRDWPRYVPGARGTDRNLGIAGERVMPDPGVPLTCLPAPVRRALNEIALRFGPVLVRSTHRGNGMFVRTDAWRGSYHRDCRAADFRVSGNPSAILAFLRARHDLGGVKRYRNGLFHVDNGPRRSW
ncbi:hypothetical protein ACJ4V0_10645 [Phreatobacter sp. HK31-P]